MKKILLASTAMVAFAGAAAAEVKLSGDARMGVVYDGKDLQFNSRMRIKFTASGETDGGLAFGGEFRSHDSIGAVTGLKGQFYISGAFGKLAMGDTVSAAEYVIGDLPEIGYTDLSSGTAGAFAAAPANNALAAGQNEVYYITGDNSGALMGPAALYTYTTGGLTFALSMNDGSNTALGLVAEVQQYSVAVGYAMGDYKVGLAYEASDPAAAGVATSEHIVLGGEIKFGDTTVKAMYGEGSGAISGFTQYGLGVTSKFDAITVSAYIKETEFGADDVMSYGIGAAYSLGGGATVVGGIADNDVSGTDPVADLGIKFTF